ncbi:MAG: formyltetrahydrofolate deformylase [Micrococcales bacterium]|nr:MAG: formyltetrahydrofolate deformylase [Micrococcales bacterium]PIE27181.1 MAG: formyltetrahydrofolate deformylase [Micrococcales bacterium]
MARQPLRPGRDFVLILSCPDQVGIVHAVTGVLAAHRVTITESQQFEDAVSRTFFMRVRFRAKVMRAQDTQDTPDTDDVDISAIKADLGPVTERFQMRWAVHDLAHPTRTIIMVSTAAHCLADLLHRHLAGTLNIDPVAVVSNHTDLSAIAAMYGVPFHHLPVSADTKLAAERSLLDLVELHQVDLVVLARYMQVLSEQVTNALPGHVINIHHSFLPGFKGARPYHQAHERGVKLIGATAHYVTPELDEGPIIEQDITRVHHGYTPHDLSEAGQDVETQVLARAVRWHTEHRVFLNGRSTVVLR